MPCLPSGPRLALSCCRPAPLDRSPRAVVTPSRWTAVGGGGSEHAGKSARLAHPLTHLLADPASPHRRATADGKLWLNGQEVSGDQALGPWTTWSQRILYRCEDVTSALLPGSNAIGVWLGSGQYDSVWTHAWCNSKKGCKPELGLRLLLRVTLRNGTSLTVAASRPEAWRATDSPFVVDDVYGGVRFDARLLTDGFSRPGYAVGGSWTAAAAVLDATTLFGPLHPHVFTPDRLISERRPVKITRPSNNSYVFWFADNNVGWAQLNNVTLAAGTMLQVRRASCSSAMTYVIRGPHALHRQVRVAG